jgi:RadC-like JAB domain
MLLFKLFFYSIEHFFVLAACSDCLLLVSGDPRPSDSDQRLTRRVAEAAKVLQIQFLMQIAIFSREIQSLPGCECPPAFAQSAYSLLLDIVHLTYRCISIDYYT